MYQKISQIEELLKEMPYKPKVAVAIGEDVHTLRAIEKASHNGLVSAIFFGDEEKTKSIISENNINLSDISFVHESNPQKAVEVAVRAVKNGEANCLMKGKIDTATLLRAVLNKEYGLRANSLLSHFALFEINNYHKLIGITDVAMNILPDLSAKIDIINNSVGFMNKIGITKKPKVAILGAIETLNKDMSATIDAALLSKMQIRNQIKNCIIDGPLAFDNAISKKSAELKGINSEVAGDADVLVVPTIEAGNILYKSLVYFSNAKVASVLLGATAPIILTSRSDSEESKYNSILLACLSKT